MKFLKLSFSIALFVPMMSFSNCGDVSSIEIYTPLVMDVAAQAKVRLSNGEEIVSKNSSLTQFFMDAKKSNKSVCYDQSSLMPDKGQNENPISARRYYLK